MRRVSWHRWVVDDASVHRADLSSPSPSLPCPLPERLTGRCFGNVAAWILSGLANCWPESASESSGRSRDSGTRTPASRQTRKIRPTRRPTSIRTSSTRVLQMIYAESSPPSSVPRPVFPPVRTASRSRAASRFRTSVSRLSQRRNGRPKRKRLSDLVRVPLGVDPRPSCRRVCVGARRRGSRDTGSRVGVLLIQGLVLEERGRKRIELAPILLQQCNDLLM